MDILVIHDNEKFSIKIVNVIKNKFENIRTLSTDNISKSSKDYVCDYCFLVLNKEEDNVDIDKRLSVVNAKKYFLLINQYYFSKLSNGTNNHKYLYSDRTITFLLGERICDVGKNNWPNLINEAPTGLRSRYPFGSEPQGRRLLPTLRLPVGRQVGEQNPSCRRQSLWRRSTEAEDSSYSSASLRSRFSAKGDEIFSKKQKHQADKTEGDSDETSGSLLFEHTTKELLTEYEKNHFFLFKAKDYFLPITETTFLNAFLPLCMSSSYNNKKLIVTGDRVSRKYLKKKILNYNNKIKTINIDESTQGYSSCEYLYIKNIEAKRLFYIILKKVVLNKISLARKLRSKIIYKNANKKQKNINPRYLSKTIKAAIIFVFAFAIFPWVMAFSTNLIYFSGKFSENIKLNTLANGLYSINKNSKTIMAGAENIYRRVYINNKYFQAAVLCADRALAYSEIHYSITKKQILLRQFVKEIFAVNNKKSSSALQVLSQVSSENNFLVNKIMMTDNEENCAFLKNNYFSADTNTEKLKTNNALINKIQNDNIDIFGNSMPRFYLFLVKNKNIKAINHKYWISAFVAEINKGYLTRINNLDISSLTNQKDPYPIAQEELEQNIKNYLKTKENVSINGVLLIQVEESDMEGHNVKKEFLKIILRAINNGDISMVSFENELQNLININGIGSEIYNLCEIDNCYTDNLNMEIIGLDDNNTYIKNILIETSIEKKIVKRTMLISGVNLSDIEKTIVISIKSNPETTIVQYFHNVGDEKDNIVITPLIENLRSYKKINAELKLHKNESFSLKIVLEGINPTNYFEKGEINLKYIVSGLNKNTAGQVVVKTNSDSAYSSNDMMSLTAKDVFEYNGSLDKNKILKIVWKK